MSFMALICDHNCEHRRSGVAQAISSGLDFTAPPNPSYFVSSLSLQMKRIFEFIAFSGAVDPIHRS